MGVSLLLRLVQVVVVFLVVGVQVVVELVFLVELVVELVFLVVVMLFLVGSNYSHPLNPFYVLPSRCRLVPRDIQRERGACRAVESESSVPLSGASSVGT